MNYEQWLKLVEAKVSPKVRARMYELVDKGHPPRSSMYMSYPCECKLKDKIEAGLGGYYTGLAPQVSETSRFGLDHKTKK